MWTIFPLMLLMASSPSVAQEDDGAYAWGKCLGREVASFAKTSTEAASIIVDAAFGACEVEERAFRRSVAKQFSKTSTVNKIVENMKSENRPRMLATILQLRRN